MTMQPDNIWIRALGVLKVVNVSLYCANALNSRFCLFKYSTFTPYEAGILLGCSHTIRVFITDNYRDYRKHGALISLCGFAYWASFVDAGPIGKLT